MAGRPVAGKTAPLPPRLERLVGYLERRYDTRLFLADAPQLANVLRQLGFALPSVPFALCGRRPWYVLLVTPDTPPLLRVVLVALVARRPERTPAGPPAPRRARWWRGSGGSGSACGTRSTRTSSTRGCHCRSA
jgi:hypothetical protein